MYLRLAFASFMSSACSSDHRRRFASDDDISTMCPLATRSRQAYAFKVRYNAIARRENGALMCKIETAFVVHSASPGMGLRATVCFSAHEAVYEVKATTFCRTKVPPVLSCIAGRFDA